jgi:hypothetical protein
VPLDEVHKYTKTLITNKCTKRILSSIVTHSYMFWPCWVIFRENSFCYRYTKVALYSWVKMCCWLCTALFSEVWTLRSRPAGRDRREFTPPVHSTQSTAHSHSTMKCNLSVTITKRSPCRWPSRVETCRSVLRLTIKLSLCICWWLVFLSKSPLFNGNTRLFEKPLLLQYGAVSLGKGLPTFQSDVVPSSLRVQSS